MPSDQQPYLSNTYPIPDTADAWWFGAYSPNTHVTTDPYYYFYGLNLSSQANNTTRDNYNFLAACYDPTNYNWDRPDNIPLPPDLIGSVHADNTGVPLSAYFVWTGPGPVPDHADFLIQSKVSASAGVNFGSAGATSGMSAKATATLDQDTVTATAGDAGSSSPPAITSRRLIRVQPVGNLITLSKVGTVITDTTNGLPYATWVDSPELPGGSGPGTYYYSGVPQNGQTSASAGANVSATANNDSRDVYITSEIEDANAKGPADEFGYFTSSPDIRNPDGSISVDSVVQWEEASIYSIEGWHVDNLPLTATPINFLSSIPSYSWSLQGLSQGWLTAPANNPTYLSLVEPDWHKFPLHGTVQVAATDSDGAVASNTYAITWHLPVENWRSIGADAPAWQLSPLEGTSGTPSGTTGPGGTISGNWEFTEDMNGKGIGLGDMFAAASGLVDPPWAAFVALTGIVFSKTQSESAVHGVSFDSTVWGKNDSTFAPSTPPGWPNNSLATMQQYQMKPKMFLEYQTQNYQGDQYGLHGYIGQTTESYDQWIAWDFAGDFSLISQSPPPPP